MPDPSSRQRATAADAAPAAHDRAAPRGALLARARGTTRAPEALAKALARRREEDLFRLTMPVLQQLAAELAPSGHVLSFLDAGGWILWTGGCAGNAERLAEAGFRPGERRDVAAAGGSVAAAAATGGSPLEPMAGGGWRCADEWITSAAAIGGARSPAPAAFVHVAAPRGAPEGRELMGARAVARVIQERLDAAVAVRELAVEHAVRGAVEARDRVFAVDAAGRLIDASDAARARLPLDGGELPAAVREGLAALLAGPAATGERSDPPAREVDWPGGGGRVKLRASAIRYREQVIGAIVRIVEARRPGGARAPEPPAPLARYGFDQILGSSDAIRAAIAQARTAARNDLPVVLSGASGTGKELFAHAIHSASARRAGAFVAVNCGSIPASLLEAELFGYEPGTFTGGRSEGNTGKFEQAHGGTLLLDEVDELSAQGQAALLRVLQELEVVRLGGSTPRRVDVRVIAASNESLRAEIGAGRFRPDLYFRLNVLAISVPPLRERRDDVRLLAEAFLRDSEAAARRGALVLSPAALGALEAYDWPGNVRELRNAILRSAATAAGDVIDVEDLPAEVRPARPAAPSVAAPPAGAGADAPRLLEREALLRALASSSSWNVAHAATALHVSRTTLYRWLRKHHIDR